MNKLLTTRVIISLLLFSNGCNNATKRLKHDWSSSEFAKQKFSTRQSYLPLHKKLFIRSHHHFVELNTTVSMTNTNSIDTLIFTGIKQYNSSAMLINDYISHPIFLKQRETIVFNIPIQDIEDWSTGGIYFDWHYLKEKATPHIEGLMISTSSNQGVSLSSIAIIIE
jgi:hypothetical protein